MLQPLLAGRETASLQLTAPLPKGVALHLAIRPAPRTMYSTSNYDAYVKLMANFAAGYLDPAFKRMKKGLKYERPTDDAFTAVFQGFTEISGSLDALALSEVLIGLAPPRSKRVDKDKYFGFLVGGYLQEIYILEQRLASYGKKLSRLYSRPALPAAVRRVVYEPLEGIIGTRGTHVHARRFSDSHIDALQTYALFRRTGHHLGEDLELGYAIAQRQWTKTCKGNHAALCRVIDEYFGIITAVVAPDGKVVLP